MDRIIENILLRHKLWVETSGQIGERANFRGHILDNICFWHINLKGADFTGASLQGASFKACDLTRATFDEAKMQNVCIVDCTCDYASIKKADIRHAIISHSSFVCAILDESFLYCARIENETDFSFAHLYKVCFSESKFEVHDGKEHSAIFSKSYMCCVCFSASKVRKAKFTNECDLTNSCFERARISQTDFDTSNLTDATFFGMEKGLNFVSFKQANLTRTNFGDACVSSVDFQQANLTDANFCGADIHNANFAQANLANVNLLQAKEAFRAEGLDKAFNLNLDI